MVLHSKVISPVLGYALPLGQSAQARLLHHQLSLLMILKSSASVVEQAAGLNESYLQARLSCTCSKTMLCSSVQQTTSSKPSRGSLGRSLACLPR